MLEASTGHAYLIEVNPRSTQVGHLSLGAGHDLPAALYAALSGKAVPTSPKVTEKDTVALFPQEWIRDPESPFLRSAYHDVPWEEPELIQDCVSNRRKTERLVLPVRTKAGFGSLLPQTDLCSRRRAAPLGWIEEASE